MRKLALLNTSIIPSRAGQFSATGRNISLAEAKTMIAEQGFVSHIGHDSTAQLASTMFGQDVPASRAPWNGEGTAIIIQLRGRPPEGRILSLEEIKAIGYDLRVMSIAWE